MARMVKDTSDALQAVASVTRVLANGMSARRRDSSSSDEERVEPTTGPRKPSGFFHDRRIVSDAEFNANFLPGQYETEMR